MPRAWAASREERVAQVVQPAGPSAGRQREHPAWVAWAASQEELEALHQASEAWAASREEQGVRRLASAAWAASPEEQEALRQASEAWAASREELEALRQAWGAWAAYRVVQVGHRRAAWGAYRVEQVVLRRVAWVAWVAWVASRVAWGVSRRSSSIPQRRYGATDCWMHDEHITILHGCVWQVWAKTHDDSARKGGFM